MDRYWFFTWRTYGTWLPGEDGFVGNYVTSDGQHTSDNRRGEWAGPPMPSLAAHAGALMAHQPIYLSQLQAERVLDQLHETARYRGRIIDAVAVLSNHIHLVFGTTGDPDHDKVLEDWKAYASRALNRLAEREPLPLRPVWWARGGSTRVLKAVARRAAAIRYVRDQANPLALYLSDEASQLFATHPDELWAEALGEPRP